MIAESTVFEEPTSSEHQAGGSLSATEQYVSFWIEDQLLGVPVEIVQEVLQAQRIARVPGAHPAVSGLLNLRGQIVTAVNLRHRLGLPDRDGEQEPHNIVVRHYGESFSFLVDEVGDVIDVFPDRMEAPPQTLDARWKGITRGVFRLDERLFVILNVPAVLSLDA